MLKYNELISWIIEINFGKNAAKPLFEFWEEEDVDKDQAERDETLTRCGVKFTKQYYIKTYGFEEEDLEVTEVPEDTEEAPEFAESKSYEELTDEDIEGSITPEELQSIGEKILEPIIKMVMDSNSFEEVMEALSEQYPLMPADELEDILSKAMFIGETKGRLSDISK